ncbi:hypothetical protein GGI24_005802, partial [Coemansia furcata]
KITESTVFKAFFAGILADTVLIVECELVDVAPILASFHTTELAHLSVRELRACLCWLLSVTGLMHLSDIECIDASRITYSSSGACLIVIAPKEKRKGAAIKRPVYITAHREVELCPVAALKYYIATVIVANKVEHTHVTHLRIPRLSFRLLMRNVTDPALAVSSDCILNDIQCIMSLSPTSDGAPASACSVGADLAIQARIPIEEVANQGGWAGTAIVEAHYRHSQRQHSRITEHVLGSSVEDISQIAD